MTPQRRCAIKSQRRDENVCFFYTFTIRRDLKALQSVIWFILFRVKGCIVIFSYLFVFPHSFSRGCWITRRSFLQSINLFGGHHDFPVFDTLNVSLSPLLLCLIPLFFSLLRLPLLSISSRVWLWARGKTEVRNEMSEWLMLAWQCWLTLVWMVLMSVAACRLTNRRPRRKLHFLITTAGWGPGELFIRRWRQAFNLEQPNGNEWALSQC